MCALRPQKKEKVMSESKKALDENVTGSSETFLSISVCSLSSYIVLPEVVCGQLIDFLSEK